MTILNSAVTPLGAVTMPVYQGRQDYMHTFDVAAPVMRAGFEDYLGIVCDLLSRAGITTGMAHMTVDEKVVEAGMSQRRPGPHVDGRFETSSMYWGHPSPGWAHGCNDVPACTYKGRMPVIVAADVAGCIVYEGEIHGEPDSDGDCSHMVLGEGRLLPAQEGFLLSPDCVHESKIFGEDTRRVFLRIATDASNLGG